MNKDELKDKAMQIASGNYLIEQFTFNEFTNLTNDELEDNVALICINFDPADVSERIMDLFNTIYIEFINYTTH